MLTFLLRTWSQGTAWIMEKIAHPRRGMSRGCSRSLWVSRWIYLSGDADLFELASPVPFNVSGITAIISITTYVGGQCFEGLGENGWMFEIARSVNRTSLVGKYWTPLGGAFSAHGSITGYSASQEVSFHHRQLSFFVFRASLTFPHWQCST